MHSDDNDEMNDTNNSVVIRNSVNIKKIEGVDNYHDIETLAAVINNLDLEHLDCYKNLEDLQSAFIQFANSIPFYGLASLCVDSKNVRSILPNIKRPYIAYTHSYSTISCWPITQQIEELTPDSRVNSLDHDIYKKMWFRKRYKGE